MAYARKEERFWTDPELRKIDYTSRYLFDWFFTNPQRHFSGIYFFEKILISPQTGIPPKLIDKSIKELQEHGFINVCKEHSTVFVVNMLKHQTAGNPLSKTQAVGINNHLKTLHCECFKESFNSKYNKLFKEDGDTHKIPPKEKPIGIDRGIDRDMETSMYINSQSQSKSNIKNNGVDEDFEFWWKEFPSRRKQGKPGVLAKWRHLKKSGILPPISEMISTLRAQKASIDWTKNGGDYIPGPLPYLNQSKFIDESVCHSQQDNMDSYMDSLIERDGVKRES